MFPQEQPSRPQYHLPCRPSTACRHRTRPPNTRGSVGSCGGSCGGGFGPRNVGVAGAGPLLLALGAGLVGVWVFRWCPTLPLPGGGSTIGAGGLSFRVRYGSGRFPAPLWPPGRWWGVVLLGVGFPPGGGVGGLVLGCVVDAVGSPGACVAFLSAPLLVRGVAPGCGGRPGVGVVPACCGGGLCGVCSCWPISTGRLSPLPGVHLRPIHPVVCWGPSATPVGVVWRPGLGGGFPLRCFQRLPVPNVANQRCPWRDNWRTRGSSVPVLSYWGRVSSSLLRAQRIGTELSHDVLNPARVPL